MKYATALILAAMPTLATAQENCAPQSGVAQYLAENYGESRQIIALSGDGLVIEIFASERGTWSFVATSPQGVSCLIGSGDSYQYLAEPLPPLGEEG